MNPALGQTHTKETQAVTVAGQMSVQITQAPQVPGAEQTRKKEEQGADGTKAKEMSEEEDSF